MANQSVQLFLIFLTLSTLLPTTLFGMPPDNRIYQNPDYSIEERVDDLLNSMTLKEKVGQINMPCAYQKGIGWGLEARGQGVHGTLSLEVRKKQMEGALQFARGTHNDVIGPGGGFFTLPDRLIYEGPRQQAELLNELQRVALEDTRLGIPLLQNEEGTHGLMCAGGTIFPEGNALGGTFNMDLIERIYAAAAEEARAIGVHQLFTLVIEPNRDPRHGRNIEGYSEDPFLCSRIAEAITRGAQGSDIAAPDKVVAGLCHYPGQTEGLYGINRGSLDISEYTLRRVFLPPWEAGIRNAGALGVMATHPTINGVPNHASEKHLTEILRGELGFEGLVLSEGSNTNILLYEHVAATEKEAGPPVIKAGVDVDIALEPGYQEYMVENVHEGNIDVKYLDRAVRRILTQKFRLGLFENPYVDPDRAERIVHNKEHQDLALEAAREGIVLLKNENNLLPLDKNIGSIAVIGPNADADIDQLGDYIPHHIPQEIVTVLDGIQSAVGTATRVSYVKGCEVLETDQNNIAEAEEAARNADVAVVVVGENDETSGESADAANLDLTGLQLELIQRVYDTGTPTVVVLINGRPLSIRWTAEHIPAIVEAWFCGEQGGTAVAEVLFGDYNPSGRLSITIPRHVGQLPFYYNYLPSKQNRMRIGYNTMPLTPLYAFGHGLSYTEFEYSNLQISSQMIGPDGTVRVSVDVENTGTRPGKEVVQLYINDVISSIVTPVIELKGFRKIELQPDEKKTVEFLLTPAELSLYNQYMEQVVEPGTFELMVGRASDDIRLTGEFEVRE